MTTTAKSYKGRGVVLHTIKYGENSMVVHLLTDVGGRQSFIVQGIRSSRGRGSKAALFQPLFTLEFDAITSSRSDLHRFREVHSGITLRQTPFDIRRSTIALFIAEVLYRLIKEAAPNISLFNQIWAAIEALDSMEEGLANFHLWFLTNLSPELGFTPSGEYTTDAWFDIREGTFCRYKPTHKYTLDQENTALLNKMMNCDVNDLANIPLSRTQRVRFLDEIIKYYQYHLDEINNIQSLNILKELF